MTALTIVAAGLSACGGDAPAPGDAYVPPTLAIGQAAYAVFIPPPHPICGPFRWTPAPHIRCRHAPLGTWLTARASKMAALIRQVASLRPRSRLLGAVRKHLLAAAQWLNTDVLDQLDAFRRGLPPSKIFGQVLRPLTLPLDQYAGGYAVIAARSLLLLRLSPVPRAELECAVRLRPVAPMEGCARASLTDHSRRRSL